MKPLDLASYIDHTALKADLTTHDIRRLCDEALEHRFFSVCVNSRFVSLCAQFLKNSPVKITCVVGFPLGAMSTAAKSFETAQAAAEGAHEIDMVLAVGPLKEGLFQIVEQDIAAVVQAAGPAPVKVILETALLDEAQKVRACELSRSGGALFVKTCTGFGGGQATVEDVRLMKKAVGPDRFVKASGGIKTFEQAKALIDAGATRLGTSSGLALIGHQQILGNY